MILYEDRTMFVMYHVLTVVSYKVDRSLLPWQLLPEIIYNAATQNHLILYALGLACFLVLSRDAI